MRTLPTKKELIKATLDVIDSSNGVMTTSDINEKVAKLLDIPSDLLEIEDANCTGTEYGYRMRWVRTELKQKGYIINVQHGKWAAKK